MDVQPVTAGRLLHCDGDVLASPAAGRPHLMGRMSCVEEQDRLIRANRVEQVLVSADVGLLFGIVEAARHGFRLAIVEAQTMHQRDQTGMAVAHPKALLHKGPDLSGAAGMTVVDPLAQCSFLLDAKVAAATLVVEGLQSRDAASLVGPIPIAYRVVVQQQSRCDTLAAPPLVEKNDGVRPTSHPILRTSVPSKPSQGSSLISREKSAASHTPHESCSPATSSPFSASQ